HLDVEAIAKLQNLFFDESVVDCVPWRRFQITLLRPNIVLNFILLNALRDVFLRHPETWNNNPLPVDLVRWKEQYKRSQINFRGQIKAAVTRTTFQTFQIDFLFAMIPKVHRQPL